MSCVAFVTLLIVGLEPQWRDDACDRPFSSEDNFFVCDRQRTEGKAWAESLATVICNESERQSIPRDWVTADIHRESSFMRGDPCPFSLSQSRVVSREVLSEEHSRERICWTRSRGNIRENCQPVIVLEEDDEYLTLDRCAYGEIGLMQLRDHEFRSGTIVPSTGEALPRSLRERRELVADPEINISLGCATLARVRDDCCGDDEECRADPTKWLGAYNTGRCDGSSSTRYVRNVNSSRVKGLEYACEFMPDEPECRVMRGEELPTPEGEGDSDGGGTEGEGQ